MRAWLLLLLLGGCTTIQPKVLPPAVQIKTLEVVKIVPVPCIAREDIPASTPTAIPLPDADDDRLAAGVFIDLHKVVEENDDLRRLLVQCSSGLRPQVTK